MTFEEQVVERHNKWLTEKKRLKPHPIPLNVALMEYINDLKDISTEYGKYCEAAQDYIAHELSGEHFR